jgi:D-aspartate ligase
VIGERPGAVVIGSDLRALAVVRSLGRRGIPTVLVDGLPRSAWFSRYVQARFRWEGATHGAPFLEFLVELAVERALDGWLLFATYDDAVEMVASERRALTEVYRLTAPAWESLRQATSRRLTCDAGARAGVPLPRTRCPAGPDDLPALDLPFPVVVRPASSGSFQPAARPRVFPARNLEELAAAYERAAELVGRDGLVVQEFIAGGGAEQYSVAAFCRRGETLVAMTARRSRQYPVDLGLGTCFVEAVEVPELLPLAEALIEQMGLSGMVEIEFKRDPRDGRYKLLDVNVRAWEWHGLCAACGIDFPYLQYRETLGRPLPTCRVAYGRRWRRLLTDLPAALTEMSRGTLSPAAYARSFAGPTVRSVLDLRDPRPAAADRAAAAGRAAAAAWRRAAPAAPVGARYDGLGGVAGAPGESAP